MSDLALNKPLAVIENISVRQMLLLDKCICFEPGENICFQNHPLKGLQQNRCR